LQYFLIGCASDLSTFNAAMSAEFLNGVRKQALALWASKSKAIVSLEFKLGGLKKKSDGR
jgi:hypothetical protein